MFRFPPLTPFVKKLLIALFATYVLQILLGNWAGVPLFNLLALDTSQLGLHTLWQLGTYVFAADTGPGYVFPMLITLLFMWLMLAPFEQRFGGKRALQLCLASALASAVLALLVGLALPGTRPIFGAGALVLGTLAAFAWSYRGQGRLNFFGMVDMKPVHIIYLALGLSLLMFITSGQAESLAADLGAIGGGMGFIEYLRRPPRKRRKPKRRTKRPRDLTTIQGGREDKPRWLN